MAKPAFTTLEIVRCLLDLSVEKIREGDIDGRQAWLLLEAAKRLHNADEDAQQQNFRGARAP